MTINSIVTKLVYSRFCFTKRTCVHKYEYTGDGYLDTVFVCNIICVVVLNKLLHNI